MEDLTNILSQFGMRVRKFRLEQDLSQEELAHRANLHRTYIGMIERAEKNITLINIKKLSVALDVSLHELLNEL